MHIIFCALVGQLSVFSLIQIKFPSLNKYKMWDIVEASSTLSPPPKPLLCKDWILVPVKPSKRYLKHWPKSTTDDSQISSSTTFHWLCLNYRSIKGVKIGVKNLSRTSGFTKALVLWDEWSLPKKSVLFYWDLSSQAFWTS